ncbi:MlaA family lipoprotein [Desulforhabdus amnigena]|jgi:phospholipid-binding lipoprotein MlaA|uniref:VacJ family lipoprotein n=1 Tax=Desulforhabdus amnigena TaxID=40218 RepID=A0A9W6FWN2_9BACT|nr:VacJ family lipoprotein [Desulforhabdus amnigena]NLJ29853.1 VacJ family lipoprotein [Deltaproteobacteria bacterium]GLI36276.1 hypothetical protein DAMNIGENAA_37090 [Desulforhabdus amnigena]
MNATRNLVAASVVFLLLTIFMTFGNVQRSWSQDTPYQNLSKMGTATEEEEPFEEEHITTSDPLEPINRAFFTFNDKFYFWFLKPVGTVYGKVVPEGLRIGIKNAYRNVQFPVRVVNNTLQGKFKGAGIELSRFVINSALGFGGMIDIADRHFDLQPYEEDSGQTLGFYGMKPMLYINWPFLGPSTVRDTIGEVSDGFLNPLFYLSPNFYVSGGVKGGTIMNNASLRIGEYEDFKASALDPYVSMRDAYLNYRAREIKR